jgi:hypothetical protein
MSTTGNESEVDDFVQVDATKEEPKPTSSPLPTIEPKTPNDIVYPDQECVEAFHTLVRGLAAKVMEKCRQGSSPVEINTADSPSDVVDFYMANQPTSGPYVIRRILNMHVIEIRLRHPIMPSLIPNSPNPAPQSPVPSSIVPESFRIHSNEAFIPVTGDRVWAKDRQGGWYRGTVLSIRGDGTFEVRFSDWGSEWDIVITDSGNFTQVVSMKDRVAKAARVQEQDVMMLGVFKEDILVVPCVGSRILRFVPVSKILVNPFV